MSATTNDEHDGAPADPFAAKDELFGVGVMRDPHPRLHELMQTGAVHHGSMSGQFDMIGPDNLIYPEDDQVSVVGFWAVDVTTPGKLNRMVRDGLPNAVLVTAAGMVSMAFIVVVAIYASSGSLAEGLLATLIFGLVGIVAQVGGVRLLEWITGIDIGAALKATA